MLTDFDRFEPKKVPVKKNVFAVTPLVLTPFVPFQVPAENISATPRSMMTGKGSWKFGSFCSSMMFSSFRSLWISLREWQ